MDVQPHPNGIRPSGNQLGRTCAGEDYFRLLPDEILMTLLQTLASPADVLALGHTCKRLYAFSLAEELWKDLYTQTGCDRDWRGTWRDSFLGLEPADEHVQLPDVASDLLFKPHLNAQLDLEAYLPDARAEAIPRYETMDPERFAATHTHRPFILTGEMRDWPAMARWTTEALLERYGDVRFRAECVDWPLARYVDYMRSNRDESPLYLFDSHFCDKTRARDGNGDVASLEDDYTVPACFRDDAFSLLADDRPDHRWLILGPARSGSTFHKDPNGTCAWNAVVTGAKLWIMSPPDRPPPGVYQSADEAEVTSPLSIAEWLSTYHDAARATPGVLQGVCRAGELLYVPSGWWHLVVNLEDCAAVTQNFVPRAHLARVLRFLRDRPAQVSGFRDGARAHALFDARLREADPEAWAEATRERGEGRWRALRGEVGASFAFAFSDPDDAEDGSEGEDDEGEDGA